MTPQETLHSILLDAKARIKDGELYNDKGLKCYGICAFVWFSNNSISNISELLNSLIDEYKVTNYFFSYIADLEDFTDPKRLALLDWLIERTAP